MPKKPLPLIALILLLPVVVLTFFTIRSISLEQDTMTVRRELLARQRMEKAAALILTHLKTAGNETVAKTRAAYATGGLRALRKLARKREFEYALAVVNGTPVHTATALEHQYDTLRIVQDATLERVQLLQDGAESSSAALVPSLRGYILSRCSGNKTNCICVAISNAKLSDTLLDAVRSVEATTGLGKVGLLAPNGRIIGQALAKGDNPKAVIRLGGILDKWSMYAENKLSDEAGLVNTTPLYLISGALIAGWIAMVWMLHRSATLKEEAASARASVIAQLAHELRTPLANLKLHMSLLQRKSSDGAEVKRYANILDGEIDRLAHLAENAITIAKGEISKSKLETAVPDECMHAILQSFQPILAAADCKVKFIPGAPQTVSFDRTSWERCAINLIDNARKYAPGSDIEIRTTSKSEMLRLDVSDAGPGIPEARRNQVFEPLERCSATNASGFGLGLAAVRALARQNGGDCNIASSSHGAHFILTMQASPTE